LYDVRCIEETCVTNLELYYTVYITVYINSTWNTK